MNKENYNKVMLRYTSLDNYPGQTNSGITSNPRMRGSCPQFLSLVTGVILSNKCTDFQTENKAQYEKESSGVHDLLNNVDNQVPSNVFKSMNFLFEVLKSAIHPFVCSFIHLPKMHWSTFQVKDPVPHSFELEFQEAKNIGSSMFEL